MRTILNLSLILLFLVGVIFADSSRLFKSMELFEKGDINWDLLTLKRALRSIDIKDRSFEAQVLKGKILQRMSFIYWVKELEDDSEMYAGFAEKAFLQALELKPKNPEAQFWLARTYQVLATFGISYGPKYGKKVQVITESLKQDIKNSYYYKYLDGVSYLLRPSLFGGDTEKALGIFKEIIDDSKDQDLLGFYALALMEEDFYKQSYQVLINALKIYSKNEFLKNLLEEVKDELD